MRLILSCIVSVLEVACALALVDVEATLAEVEVGVRLFLDGKSSMKAVTVDGLCC